MTVTLEEKTTTNNYYTWKLINRNGYEEFIISPDNVSSSEYYDSFTLSIGTAVSLTASVVIDAEQGQYDYYIYEMNTNYDLDINNALGLVESGILIIEGTSSTPISFTQSDDDTIRIFNDL